MRRRMTMLPFGYELAYYPYKKRTETKALVRDAAPAEILDLDAGEAPKAFTLVRSDIYAEASEESRTRFYPDGPYVSEYRSVGGVLYEPLGAPDGRVSIEAFEASLAMPRSSWGRNHFGKRAEPVPSWSGRGYPRLPCYADRSGLRGVRHPFAQMTARELVEDFRQDGEPIRVKGDNREECLAQASALSHQLVLVDGIVWSSVDVCEPAWEVIEGGDNKVRVDLTLGRDPLHYVHRFRLDRRDEAVAFATRRASELGRPLVSSLPDVTVHDLSALRLDEAIETARQLLSHLSWKATDRADEVTARELGRLAERMTPSQAGEAYALVRAAMDRGAIEAHPATEAILDRFATMLNDRPDMAHESPDDDGILAGLGR